MESYKAELKDRIWNQFYARTLHISKYMLYGAAIGGLISLGSFFYETNKVQNSYVIDQQPIEFYKSEKDLLTGPVQIEKPRNIFVGFGIMTLSAGAGVLGFAINSFVKNRQLKNLEDTVQ